jgi:hypothetical protein
MWWPLLQSSLTIGDEIAVDRVVCIPKVFSKQGGFCELDVVFLTGSEQEVKAKLNGTGQNPQEMDLI